MRLDQFLIDLFTDQVNWFEAMRAFLDTLLVVGILWGFIPAAEPGRE